MDTREFEGRTVDEAIVAAMRSFRVSFEDLDIKVLSEGSKGLFGIGSKNARIQATLQTEEEIQEALQQPAPVSVVEEAVEQQPAESAPAPVKQEKESKQAPKLSDEELEEVKQTLIDILGHMNVTAEVQIKENMTLEIIGDGSGLLIGKHGQTLDSLQFLVNRIVNKNRQDTVHITIDTERYRERHIEYLQSMAVKMGQKAKRTRRSVSLEMMNPYDRRIVHIALKNEPGISTKSIGEGVFKKVVIVPRKSSR